jgi:TonB-dependent starch-binding outer membrane protein SusC
MRKLILFLFAFCLGIVTMSAQTVTGVVTGADDEQPLPGVNIKVKGTDQGTITDMNGGYSIDVSGEDAVLIFSFVGYITQEQAVGSQTEINVALEVDSKGLEEVVVIGYGVQKKSMVTGAISSIDSKDLENVTVGRVEEAIQGKTAGVFILPESGAPGAGMKVRIRGAGSNSNSNPLYIVDGVRMTDVNDISPDDIEAVEVLKDAASSAIYGAEGGNGVVIITTKSGGNKEGVVSYSFKYGIQSVGTLPELLNGRQYAEYQNEAGVLGTTLPTDQVGTDWLAEMFETAPIMSHNLSFSGGTEKTAYYASLNYFNQEGVLGGDKSKFDRFSTRLNIDHKVKSWLKVGTNITYSRSKRSTLNEDSEFGGLIGSGMLIDPLTPTHYPLGTVPTHVQTLIDAGNPVRMAPDGRYFGISEYIAGEMVNPFIQMDIAKGGTVTDKVIGALSIEISPIKGLTITSRPAVDFSNSNTHFWTPAYYYSVERNNSTLSVNDNNGRWFQWQWENFISYKKEFGYHSVSAVLGMSAQESSWKYVNTISGQMTRPGDEFAEHDFTGHENDYITGNEYPDRLVSYFGRASYDYKGKYQLQGTIRRDLTSTVNVPKEGIAGIFPSFSAGWVLSEEDFFPQGFVNWVKFRGSWGQNGSIQAIKSLGQFRYSSTITTEGLRYPNSSGSFITVAEPRVLPNPDLTWETSEQTNIGIDIKAWDNRLSLTADYFIKNTRDLLLTGQYPVTSGNNPPIINAGDVKNSGFEFSVGLRNNDSELKYGVNFNLTTLKNEVTKLNSPSPRINGASIGTGSWVGATAFEVGQPIWYFRGYETAGIDAATGDPIFVDQNDDGDITDEDRVNLGDPHPNIMYGASLFVEYRGFDLNVFMQGQAGNQIIYGFMRTDRLTSNRLLEFYEGRWTPSSTNASMPSANPDGKTWSSDYMVQDGDYMRIKQIQLGYNLPASLLQAVKLSKARIYVSLDDYFTFTKYKGMDPQAGSTNDNSLGIDRGVYPTPRKVMFGLSVSF